MQPRPWPAAGRPPLATRGTGEVMTPIENNPPATCPACGCTDAAGAHAHAIAAALIDDDLDRAMTLGLLEPVACSACTDDCSKRLRQAREARPRELAARERPPTRPARPDPRPPARAPPPPPPQTPP